MSCRVINLDLKSKLKKPLGGEVKYHHELYGVTLSHWISLEINMTWITENIHECKICILGAASAYNAASGHRPLFHTIGHQRKYYPQEVNVSNETQQNICAQMELKV